MARAIHADQAGVTVEDVVERVFSALDSELEAFRLETIEIENGVKQPMADFIRATELTPAVEKAIDDAFLYHPWTDEQMASGVEIREALAAAVKAIVKNAPPCPDRSAAIRKLREARMDANSAITHAGKY